MSKPKVTGTVLLNLVQSKVIEFCNRERINLADHGTIEQFKCFIVALTVQLLQQAGHTMEDAYNIVFGDDAFRKLADDLWETFQAKA